MPSAVIYADGNESIRSIMNTYHVSFSELQVMNPQLLGDAEPHRKLQKVFILYIAWSCIETELHFYRTPRSFYPLG